ncbi:hypothetical protein MIC448_1860006 [Microbacterium sp. C448]|nr:hypothetical protein MIC448_1860006 [Microbacterium sp. C448]
MRGGPSQQLDCSTVGDTTTHGSSVGKRRLSVRAHYHRKPRGGDRVGAQMDWSAKCPLGRALCESTAG